MILLDIFLQLLCAESILGLAATALPHVEPLNPSQQDVASPKRKLHGRFLHITDFHPDPFFKFHSSIDSSCHHKSGPAGYYGAETSDCDSPYSLVNATFDWIKHNLKDQIDFVIWTGDSARHDNDNRIPRNTNQVVTQNEFVISKFVEVFGNGKDDENPTNDLSIPIVPTFGNNDILPHNIFQRGPNKWTNKFLSLWKTFIPEEQRHQFQRGGWFSVEAIPGRLAIFSLNTLYFFDSNSGVDGCAAKSEPGYEHMEWLRIQLQRVRERGMKAIVMGHVPPARTENKMSWDETCWQKYALWMQQYRDVIVGQFFGHMNVAHFMFQDFEDIKKKVKKGIQKQDAPAGRKVLDEISIASAKDYLIDLKNEWAELATLSESEEEVDFEDDEESIIARLWNNFFSTAKKKKKKHPHRKNKDRKMGGRWGERFSVSHVAASVVPNYLPSLRVFEYNTTGLESALDFSESAVMSPSRPDQLVLEASDDDEDDNVDIEEKKDTKELETKDPEEQRKKKKKYKFKVPKGPSKSTPPGPMYSPQPLTLLSYTQYLANLTYINNDADASTARKDKPHPHPFEYEVEYNTAKDKVFALKDLTVRSYLDLAKRIGSGDGKHSMDSDLEAEKKKKKKKKHGKKKHKKKKKGKNSKEWFTFVQRAFVESLDPDEIEDKFGYMVENEATMDRQEV